jgi:predicted dehydrogenase
MGLSHFSIINANPRVEVVAICDTAAYALAVLRKYLPARVYSDYRKMIASEQLDAVIVATPSHVHAEAVEALLAKKIHVFCEKPFCIDIADGARLADMSEGASVVNQVGYHYRYVAAFAELRNKIQSGSLGRIHHVRAEAFGPVVLRPSGSTWRSSKAAGGGCLLDYASHAIDLVVYLLGRPDSVSGASIGSIFSRDVEDEVYATLNYNSGLSGQLSVNWSDQSQRKMATTITVWGENGKASADRQEVRTYLRSGGAGAPAGGESWETQYTTDLTQPVEFYLRGEEYSAQLEDFVDCVIHGRTPRSTFRTALDTDLVVDAIRSDSQKVRTAVGADGAVIRNDKPRTRRKRLFGV